MALTPLDIENYRIRTSFRGYNREDVDRLLEQVVRGIEDYVHQIGQLNARLGQLESQVARYRESEELLTKSVMLAEKTRDELISAAQQRAEAIREDALSEAERIRASIGDIASQREQFEYAFHGLLTGFIHRLEAGNPRLGGRREHERQYSSPGPHDVEGRELPLTAEAAAPQVQQTAAGSASGPLFAQQAAQSTTPAVAPYAAQSSHGAGPGSSQPPERDSDIEGFEAALSQARPAPTSPPQAELQAQDSARAFAPGFTEADAQNMAGMMQTEEPTFVIHTHRGDVFPEYSEPGKDWGLDHDAEDPGDEGTSRTDREDK